MRLRPSVDAALVVAGAVLLVGCTAGGGPQPEPVVPFIPPAVPPVQALGDAEKAVTVLAPPGLLPATGWVTQFTADTGCVVSVTPYTSAGSLRSLAEVAGVDLIAAPSLDVLGLAGAGAIAPVNPDLLPGIAGLRPELVAPEWSTVDGVGYGVAIGRAAFGPDRPLPDDETRLAAAAADTADDPYALDRDQLAAAALAVQQADGDPPLPEAGLGTAWSWTIGAAPEHPTCAYRLLQATLAPAANRALAEAAGGLEPSVTTACPGASPPAGCEHSDDPDYWDQVRIALTPLQECWDGREVRCTDLPDWTAALADADAGRIPTPSPT